MTAINPALGLLYNAAADVARREDAEQLSLTGTVIFFVPEIAFAYAVGKGMTRRAKDLFPSQDVRWSREQEIGGGGGTDLIFAIGDHRPIAVEFKLAAQWMDYTADQARAGV